MLNLMFSERIKYTKLNGYNMSFVLVDCFVRLTKISFRFYCKLKKKTEKSPVNQKVTKEILKKSYGFLMQLVKES